MLAKLFAGLALTAVLCGCGPAISQRYVQEARLDPGAPLDFAALQADPARFKGKTVVLGGEIISVSLKDDKSLLAVSQQELSPSLEPYGPAHGTFYVLSDEFLPPSYYIAKRKVTVAGVVQGTHEGAPLLKARQIHLGSYPVWEKWYYPIPREWYDYDPALEHWFTPPYFDPWRGGRGAP
ncbi:MAG: Slp family lipoprotein [Deltaproteobacteria bacterium]|nr:Slp family lipoprotein [Deltaproteobacteria bacterium]